jgi:hypothetical protein
MAEITFPKGGDDRTGYYVTVEDSLYEGEPCLVQGGFGACTDTMGSALMVKGMWSGLQWRSERYYITADIVVDSDKIDQEALPYEQVKELIESNYEAADNDNKDAAAALGIACYHYDYKLDLHSAVIVQIIDTHRAAYREVSRWLFWLSILPRHPDAPRS